MGRTTALSVFQLPLLLLVLASLGASKQIGSVCPSTCVSALGRLKFLGRPAVSGNFGSISQCRKACSANRFKYYSFATNGQCSCFATCSGTTTAPPTAAASRIGLASKCADVVCPSACTTAAAKAYISSPGPVLLTQQTSIKACQQLCKGIGTFYTYSSASTCSCYQGCQALRVDADATPARMGRLSSCFKPRRPKPRSYRCTPYANKCPLCVSGSQCVNTTTIDFKVRYQCCCKPGTNPVLGRNRQLVQCK